MNIKLTSKSSTLPTLIACWEKSEISSKVLGKSKHELLSSFMKKKLFSGKSGESVSTHLSQKTAIQKISLFGLGKKEDINDTEARNLGAKMVQSCQQFQENTVNIVIPDELKKHLQAFIEGMVMGNYSYEIFKTEKAHTEKEKKKIKKIELICTEWKKEHEKICKEADLIGQVVNYTRTIVNCGPEQMSTNQFVKEAKEVAKENGYKITDLDHKKLTKMGMGGILAVNRGSEEPAHMIILEHNSKSKEAPIVFCGKGIIFDTGGVSIKPASSMNEMQLDMAGAAAVLGVFKLLKKLGIKRKVVGIMPVTDNAVSSKSYRPSDVVTTYSGKTVEIMNTDAEGRMILSDALAYGVEKYKPEYLVDMATLTGACMVALGYGNAGLFGNDDKLQEQLLKASENTDESLWKMPITKKDEEAMKGKLADLTNLDMTGRYAGASRAAAFLKNFVGDSKWAHIDIAGPSYTKEPKPYEKPMATGFGIRLMIDFIKNN